MAVKRGCVLGAALLAAAVLCAPAFGADITADVVYGHKDGMALTYDVFKPAETNGAGILLMVSGGWFSRWSPPETVQPRLQALLDEGFTLFAVRHGSAPRYKVPEAYADVKKALLHIRENCAAYGIDKERLGVFGYSAGGHLSLMLGTTGEISDPEAASSEAEAENGDANRVAAVVAYFPPVDLRQITGPNDRFPALDFDPSLSESVSPLLHVTPDDPPTLLIHGDKDDLVPVEASKIIHEAFKEKGVTTDILIIEGGGHGFQDPAHQKASSDAMVNWFKDHLGVE